MLEVDGSGLVSYGFDEGGQVEIARSAQEAFRGAYDQGKRHRIRVKSPYSANEMTC